jgi:hypothetical protein
MFASPTPPQRWRTVVVVHHRDGTLVAHRPFGLLPLEAVRTTSLAIAAVLEDAEAVRSLLRSSLELQSSGWRSFDQVWPPLLRSVPQAHALCLHRIPAHQVKELVNDHPSHCSTMVEVAST